MSHYSSTPQHPPHRAPISTPPSFHRPTVYPSNPKSIYATPSQRSTVTQQQHTQHNTRAQEHNSQFQSGYGQPQGQPQPHQANAQRTQAPLYPQQQQRPVHHAHRHSMYELAQQYQNPSSQSQQHVQSSPFFQPPSASLAYAAAMSKVQQRIQQANAIAAANAQTSQFQHLPQQQHNPHVQQHSSYSSTPHSRPQTVAPAHSFDHARTYSQPLVSPQRQGPTPGLFHAVSQGVQSHQQAPPPQPVHRGRPESIPPMARHYQQPLQPPASTYPQTPAPPSNVPYAPPQTPFSHRHSTSNPVSPARAPSMRRPLPTPAPGSQMSHQLQRTASNSPQRRELPHSPTAPPDLRQISPARNGNVSQLVSRFSNGTPQHVPLQETQSMGYPFSHHQRASASASTPSLPLRSSTLPSEIRLQQNHDHAPVTPAQQGMNQIYDNDDDYSDEEQSIPGDWRRARTPSPQYGIRDLPSRNANVTNTTQSPQHGIRDLPSRKKEEHFDLRSIQTHAPRVPALVPTSPTKRALPMPSPTRSQTMPSSPQTSSSTHYTPRVEQDMPLSNSSQFTPRMTQSQSQVRHPTQPPSPQQSPSKPSPFERRSPTVVQPQPTRQERQPSWSLPAVQQGHRNISISLAETEERLSGMIIGGNTLEPEPVSPVRHDVQLQVTTRPLSRAAPPLHTPRRRRGSVIDLNLDDAPPAPLPLRRSPSPSPSPSSSSSAPSIPMIKTPDEERNTFVVPQISLPGGASFDDDEPSKGVSIPSISISSTSPKHSHRASIPAINVPGGDDEDTTQGHPSINVSTPRIHVSSSSSSPAMPVILKDLSSSSSSKRSLPQPPGTPSSSSANGSGIRSRGGGLVCGGCRSPIVGRIVSAMNLRWHPHCFKCTTCGELLEHVSSYEHDGKAYCHLDYHEKFAPQCYHCKTPIIDERFITLDDPALGKRTYHEQHFFCAECGDPFLAPTIPKPASKRANNEISIKGDGAFDIAVDEDGDEVGFTVYRGHPYCETCHVRLRNPKCKGCKKTITDGMRAVEALGGKWCWQCFVCAGCNTPFEDPSFFQRDKKPYCEPCFSLILRNDV